MQAERPRAKSRSRPRKVRPKLKYPQGDLSIEEWSDTRSMMYSELRDRSIPANIIQAVEDGRQHASVSWLCTSGEPPKTAEDATSPVVAHAPKPYRDEESIEPRVLIGETRLTDGWPKTAGETLAHFLSAEIEPTRRLSNAPVRRGKHLPKATVSWVANDLLEGCRRFPPGYYLKELLRKLLDVDRLKKNQSKQYVARSGAVWIVAQAPQLDSEEIARELGVDRSSVSRWRTDPIFQQRVSNVRKHIAYLKEQGKWSTFNCRGE
jgi:hypothetical protein